MKNLVIFLSIVIWLFGCDKLYDENPEEAVISSPVIKVQTLSEDQFNIKYIPQNVANKYSVLVTWPSFSGHVRLIKDKVILNEQDTEKSSFLIIDIDGGIETTFSVETYNPERGLTKDFKIIAKPPKDLIFDGTVYLSSNVFEVADRIFLNENSTIYLLDFDLNLKFSSLYVGANSKIQSFPSGARAFTGQAGRSSGNLNLEGHKIIGTLTLNMNSEGGGDGAEGEVLCHGGRISRTCEGGSGGNSGVLGSFNVELEDWSQFSFRPALERSIGGVKGGKFTGNLNYSCNKEPTSPERVFKTCEIVPVDGKPATGGTICIKYGIGAPYECKN